MLMTNENKWGTEWPVTEKATDNWLNNLGIDTGELSGTAINKIWQND